MDEKKRAENTALAWEYGSRVVKDGKSKVVPIRDAEELQNVFLQGTKRDAKIRAFLQSVQPMDKEWKERIQKDFWWGRKDPEPGIDPILYKLRDKLLSFGGESVCLTFGEEDAEEILTFGQFWHGYRAFREKGQDSHCHENSLYLARHVEGYKLCTGYALSDDGMWRQHSWCIYKAPQTVRIVETTVPRVAYFGYVLGKTSAEEFEQRLW